MISRKLILQKIENKEYDFFIENGDEVDEQWASDEVSRTYKFGSTYVTLEGVGYIGSFDSEFEWEEVYESKPYQVIATEYRRK